MADWLLMASYLLLWLCVIVVGVLLLVLFRVLGDVRDVIRQNTRPYHASESIGLEVGQIAPEFSARTAEGDLVNSSSLGSHLNALLFVSPTCPTCVATAMEIEAISTKTSGSVYIVCEGQDSDCRSLLAELSGPYPFLIDEARTVGRTFGIVSTPTVVIIDAEGRIDRFGSPMRKEDLEKIAPEMFLAGTRPQFL